MENNKRRDFTPRKIEMRPLHLSQKRTRVQISCSDDIIILSNFISTGLHGYQIMPGLSTNKQKHHPLLLKTEIHVAPTHL